MIYHLRRVMVHGMEYEKMSDAAVLQELGERLRRVRLNRDITQAELARRAGVSRRTLQKAEDGEVTTLETFVAILRGLGLIAQIGQLLPESLPSPVQLARLQSRARQRASGKRKRKRPADGWQWGE